MFKKTLHYLSRPKNLASTNAVLLTLVLLINTYFQVFCQPTLWAFIVLTICFLNTIIYPIVTPKTGLFYLTTFISGISFGVFIYCVIFLGRVNFIGLILVLLIIGTVTFIPHFFVVQLFSFYLIRSNPKNTRLLFLCGILAFAMTTVFFNIQYRNALNSIEKFNDSGQTTLDKNFMTEKIFGMYFKYHTEFSAWDGWRPPLHEPALIIGQFFNGKKDPLNLTWSRADLKKRIIMYKKFFPDNQIKSDCSCAIKYSDNYHNDEIFKTP